jgi:hypothetical protein
MSKSIKIIFQLGTIIQTGQQEIGELAEPEHSLLPIHQMKVSVFFTSFN